MSERRLRPKTQDIRVHFQEDEDDEDLLEMIGDLPGFDETRQDDETASQTG